MNKLVALILIIMSMLVFTSCTEQEKQQMTITDNQVILPDKQSEVLDDSLTVTSANVVTQQTYSNYHFVSFMFDASTTRSDYYLYDRSKIIVNLKSDSFAPKTITQTYTYTLPLTPQNRIFTAFMNIEDPAFSDLNFCDYNYPVDLAIIESYLCSQSYTNCVKDTALYLSEEYVIHWECPCQSHSEKRCYGGDVYYYDSCGVREERFDDCSSSESCTDGVCDAEPECDSGEQKCVGTTTYQVCSSGSWGSTQTCSSGLQCSNGQCVSNPVCQPNNKECLSATAYRICSTSGTWGQSQNCNTGETCTNGVCSLALCTQTGEKKCVSQTIVATCDSNHNWIEQGCPTNTICNAGVCVVNNGTICKAYEELKDSECKFSITKAFTGSGFNQLREDRPEIVYGTGIIIVLAIIALIMYFKYKKSSDVFY